MKMVSGYMNYEWFLKQDLSEYAGKWVAILDKKVVASGDDAGKVIEEVKKRYPGKKPFLAKVRGILSGIP